MSPGPIPNLQADLARPRERRGGDVVPVTKGERRSVSVPHADPEWHPIARKMWDSLKTSGQAEFYQQSDWAFAYSLMDDLSFYKKPYTTADGHEYHKRSGQMLAVIYQSLGNLLVTEADRRRLRLELHEPEEEQEDAALVAIDDYRADLDAD